MKSSQYELLKGHIKNMVEDIEDTPPEDFHLYTRVQLNGEIIGLVKDNEARGIYRDLKKLKYENIFDPHISVTHDIRSEIENKDIRVHCDSGRIFHPMLRVEDNKVLLTKDMINKISIEDTDNANKITSWNEFMIKNPGVIEYLDSDERANCMGAMLQEDVEEHRIRMIESKKRVKTMTKEELKVVSNRYDDMTYVKHTHCEIHPSLLIGVVVSIIPFMECNQGPRNIYQYSQARQAMGIYATNYRDRLDISYILYHPQKPIVTTRTTKYTGSDYLPAGENTVVAIACYTGLLISSLMSYLWQVCLKQAILSKCWKVNKCTTLESYYYGCFIAKNYVVQI